MLEELTVTAWQYFGHDRLYVNLPDGTPIGWADRRTGGITVVHARYRDDVTDMLARRAPELLTRPLPEVRVHPGAFDDTDEPAAEAEAAGAVGAAAAAPSRPVELPPPAARAAGGAPVRSTPGPAGAQAPASPGRPDRLPLLTPENDLASRRPGTTLREESSPAGATTAAPDSGRLERLSSRLLRRRPMPESRRKELLGERRTGAEVGRLTRHGWRVLHSIPLGDGADIDHLLIGPGGVFTIRTEYHPQQSVRADDDTVRIDDSDPLPYIAECRAEAALVRKVLGSHCDFPVRVHPVLVFVDAASLDVAATLTDVRVYRERQVSALAPLSGELTVREADRLFDVARRAEVWGGA
ncbi:nuclease-related domain-containing protein [Streptomyces sp. NPDC048389]|uniref:nuclease-related domain-containing protein n=1 Tax=Streptomyces sp. NPDC048389 TaxID=3154622 RepID=UPI0034559DC4